MNPIRVVMNMINKCLLLLVLCIFSQVGLANPEIRAEAEAALGNGEMELALEKFMVLAELAPVDPEVYEMTSMLAMELGLPDIATEMWRRRVLLAITVGDKDTALQGNAEIAVLNNAMPEWVQAKLTAISQISDEAADAYEAWQAMTGEAQAAIEAGEAENALAAQESALMVASEAFGDAHWLTIASNRDLGYLYRMLGQAQQAEQYYGAALTAAEKQLGASHPNYLQINELVADLYAAIGMVDEANMVASYISKAYGETLGSGHELAIRARMKEVQYLKDAREYGRALESLQGLCGTLELSHGAYHPETVSCLRSIASLQVVMGSLADAEQGYKTVIERKSLSLKSVDGSVLSVLSQVAELYRVSGKYTEAKDLLSGVIQTALETGAVEQSYVAKAYLGRVFNNEGAYVQAQIVTEDVLAYGVTHWEDSPIQVFNTLLELGAIYQAQGKQADAEATFEEALEGLLKNYGESHPSSLVAANNLGQLYEQNGLYDQAEPLIKDTLRLMEQTLGAEHPNTMNTRNNLGLIHESQGNFREAEPLYKKSLEMMRRTRGENHTDTIAVKNNLAYLYMLMEKFEQSAAMFTEVKQQWIELFGEQHSSTLKATNNLGRIYQKLGDLAAAEVEMNLALRLRTETLGETHIDVIRSMIDLGGLYIEQDRTAEAEALLTKTLALAEAELGNLHPYTFEALNYLADAQEKGNKLQAAVEIREQGFIRRSEFLDTMLWTTGENAREGYVRLHRPEFNRYLSLLARINDEASGRRLVDASLQRKGLLLKVTSEIQQIATMTTDPKLSKLATALEDTRKRLAALTLSGPTAETKGKHTEMLYDLEQEVNELQGELGRASVRFRTSIAKVNAERLADSMTDGSALVDYQAFTDGDEKKLLAAVIKKEDGEAIFSLVEFENRDDIEAIVVEHRSIIQDDGADEDDLMDISMEAYNLVWSPLSEAIGDNEYVYLIPDGVLNILPFNAMMNDDEEYLIQTHDLHTLTSGRDLLPSEYNLVEGDYLVVAGPDYDSQDVVSEAVIEVAKGKRSAALQMGIRGSGGGLRGLSFAPLPGAAEEGRIIVDSVSNESGESDNFFGVEAQEKVLGAINTPPEVLHIATHGFFLKADEGLRKRILKAQRSAEIHVPPPGDNPLLRAGLAFAGINANAQFLGDIDTGNDGVLTALEVLDLNLSGTRLVILSACETGLGEIHEGEGVYGLRRSFQEAGVAEVISSLWEVSDAGTQALMTDFYGKLLAGVPARKALRDVQLDLIDSAEWGYPYIWSAFMIVGSYESAGFNVN